MSGSVDLGAGAPSRSGGGGMPKTSIDLGGGPVSAPTAPAAAYPAYADPAGGREPMLQGGQRAREVATAAGTAIGSAIGRGVVEMQAYIQEFPDSVRLFSFVFGFVYAGYSALMCVFTFGRLLGGFNLTLLPQFFYYFYSIIFGLVVCVLEGKPVWSWRVGEFQKIVFRNCAFLMGYKGRGLFYTYLAVLCLGDAWQEVGKPFWWIDLLFGLGLSFMSLAGFTLTPSSTQTDA